MKRIILCISIVSCFILLSIFCLIHLKSCTEKISIQLENINYCLETDDTQGALAIARTLESDWVKSSKLALFYLEEEKVITISSSISRIISLINRENDEVYAECADLQEYVELIYETQIPYFRNIF